MENLNKRVGLYHSKPGRNSTAMVEPKNSVSSNFTGVTVNESSQNSLQQAAGLAPEDNINLESTTKMQHQI